MSVTVKKEPSKQTQVKLELTPDVVHRYIVAMAQLRAVNGLLLADNMARFSGGDSPLDSVETQIAVAHLQREAIGTLEGFELHEVMMDLHPNRAALAVEEG
jgi:hypothetical protein